MVPLFALYGMGIFVVIVRKVELQELNYKNWMITNLGRLSLYKYCTAFSAPKTLEEKRKNIKSTFGIFF